MAQSRKRVFLGGQLPKELGRLEFGNVGNWYVVHGALQSLVEVGFDVITDWGLTENSIFRNGWNERVFSLSRAEWDSALSGILESDLYLQINGDLFGDNSLALGRDNLRRALEELVSVQNSGAKTAMVGTSIGPFEESAPEDVELARRGLDHLDYLAVREPSSLFFLDAIGPVADVLVRPCPSLLYDADKDSGGRKWEPLKLETLNPPVAMFTLCGWNLPGHTWRSPPTSAEVLGGAVQTIRDLRNLGFTVELFDHSRGFRWTRSGQLEPTKGRDTDLMDFLGHLVSGALDEHETEQISRFSSSDPPELSRRLASSSLVVSGRVHAAVIAARKGVPSIFVPYLNGPQSHKAEGLSSFFPWTEVANGLRVTRELVQAVLAKQSSQHSGEVMNRLFDMARLQFGELLAIVDR